LTNNEQVETNPIQAAPFH